jgi:Cdc6-like AAA superfamily ATPase
MSQSQVFQYLLTNLRVSFGDPEARSFFCVHGEKGSGKTFLLNRLAEELKNRKYLVQITSLSSTSSNVRSLSSLLVNNERSHLYDPRDPHWLRLSGLAFSASSIEILLIDDFHRISAFLINQLDRLCKLQRKNNRPFGGLCVCAFTDFLELPPSDYIREDPETKKKIVYQHSYPFESEVWQTDPPAHLYLRQENHRFAERDLELLRLLRYGKHEDLEANPRLIHFCSNDLVNMEDLNAKQCYLVPCKALEWNNTRF